MTISEAADLLRAQDNFLLLTHVRPDGDTMGSASALCHALRQAGKTAYLYNNPQFCDNDPWIAAPYLAPADFQPSFVVAVDMADTTLFPKGFNGPVDFCVDHHPSNTHYAKQTLVQPKKASCGEIVMKLCKALMGKLDATAADLEAGHRHAAGGELHLLPRTSEVVRAAPGDLDRGHAARHL